MDSLYLQLFQALFPQFNFEDIEPGKTEEEMAENIDQLIKLLETNILEHDLSDIKAENIVGGDLAHIDEFLQVLLQVVFLMIQNQAEGEETEDELESERKQRDDKSSKKHKSDEKYKEKLSDDMKDDFHDKDHDMELHSPDIDDLEYKDNGQDLYDMDDPNDKDHRLLKDLEKEYEQQLANEGLMDEADLSNRGKKSEKGPTKHDDNEDEEPRFSDLDFYGKNPPDHKQVMIDEDEEALMMKQGKKNKHDDKASPDSMKKEASDKKKADQKPKKQEVDVLNDPLLPEGVDFGFKKKNKHRADSLGGGGSFKGGDLLGEQEDDDDLLVIDNLDELEEEQKYMVLQHLFEEYQRDPDSFPEDQKELLEHEMMKLYQKAELEGDLDDEGEFDEDDLRMAASSGKKNKGYSDEKPRNQKWIDEDSDHYDDNDPMLQNSNIKAKPRPLNEDEEDSQEDDRMNMDGEINMMSNENNDMDADSDLKENAKNQVHNEDEEDEDEKYMMDIINQQEEAKAEREEEQQKLEANQDDEGEDTVEDEDKDHDQAPQPIEITEEEFKNLPPEEQQRMLMLLQQQQLEQEGEGEENDQLQEYDPEYLNALQLQQQQLAQMQRMGNKKTKKSKKKRPSTAKYGWNSRSTRLQSRSIRRPGTAKKRKSKSKAKKRRLQEQQYYQQLQQQQLLQQLAMQQQLQQQQQDQIDEEQAAILQQNIANIQPVDENGNPIEMTEEELAEFQQNLLEQQLQQQQEGEGDNEVDQENELAQLTPDQIAMLQQQAYEQQLREQSMMRRRKGKKRASSKRRASRKKNKKTTKKKQYVDDQTAFMMMLQQNPELQQQLIQQQQMQAMEEGQMVPDQLYNVEKIDEEENEESPMKPQAHDMKDHERPTEESHHTADEIIQQNQLQADQTEDDGIYEDDENQQMLANLSPEELVYLQQKAAQEQQMMGAYPQEEMQQYYSPHQGNHRGLYDQQNKVQTNIINQNEALNRMFRNYIADMKKKEARKAKRRLKKQQQKRNRRRSFANAYGGRGGTQNVIPYKKGLDLKSKIRRDVKQVMLAKKIYMLANEIERNRLLEEKRRVAEYRKSTKTKKKSMKNTMRNRFQDQMALLKQSIESERMDRKIAKFVRTQAMQQWKRDLSRKQPQIQLPMRSYA